MYYSLLKLNNEEKNAIAIELLTKLLVEEAAEEIMVKLVYFIFLKKYLNIYVLIRKVTFIWISLIF